MVQELTTTPSIFGRLGQGLAKGMADVIPREVERRRLGQGLENLSQNTENLTPFQKYAKLVGTAHEYPQVVQSGERLLRQEAQGKALENTAAQTVKPQDYFGPIKNQPNPNAPETKTPSITKGDILKRIQEGYIPPGQEQRDQEAAEVYKRNPARFGNDPQAAIDYIDRKHDIEKQQFDAVLDQDKILSGIQNKITSKLGNQAQRLGVDIPPDVYSKIEDDAVKSVKPKSDEGEGLTEDQAMKDYGSKLDEVSREYQDLNKIGDFGILFRKPETTRTSLKSLEERFFKRGDSRNLVNKLISEHGLNPRFASSIGEPVHRYKELNNEIKSVPDIRHEIPELKDIMKFPNFKDSKAKTQAIAPKIAEALKKGGNPLSAAYELEKKGYDPDELLKYISDNQTSLDYKPSQIERLSDQEGPMTFLNDWWLKSWTGLK